LGWSIHPRTSLLGSEGLGVVASGASPARLREDIVWPLSLGDLWYPSWALRRGRREPNPPCARLRQARRGGQAGGSSLA
jgi:hypothetical protein